MVDKRQMANDELQKTLDSGILSFVEPQSQSFAELPESPQTDNPSSVGNVFNNFNVNVSVNGDNSSKHIQNATTSSTHIQNSATTAIKNALPTMNDTADEIKKNSLIDFQGIYGEESNPININHDEPDILNNLYSVYNFENNSSADYIYSKLGSFQNAEISHYTYSESKLKADNTKINSQYEILKNIIHSPEKNENDDTANISPYIGYDNSLYIDQTMDNRMETINNLNVENNTNNNLEAVMELSKRRERLQQQQIESVNKTVRSIEDLGRLNENEVDDVVEATTIGKKNGAGPSSGGKHDGRKPTHINSQLIDMPKFIEKMNRPPIWRSVLG